jgi:hypothetical protein
MSWSAASCPCIPFPILRHDMADSSSSTTWLRGRPYAQKAPLKIAHMTHRDVILLVDPDIHLLNFVAEHPSALGLDVHKWAFTEENTNASSESRRAHGTHLTDFYRKHFDVVSKIMVLTSRLDNLRYLSRI